MRIGHQEREAWENVLAAEDAHPLHSAKEFLGLFSSAAWADRPMLSVWRFLIGEQASSLSAVVRNPDKKRG